MADQAPPDIGSATQCPAMRDVLVSTVLPDDPVAAYFNNRAVLYGGQMWLERSAFSAVAELAEPLAGARVIDLATGTGGVPVALYARRHRMAALVAVDASPRMMERARERLRRAQPSPRFVQADARKVPLPDATADVVTIGYLLHLVHIDAQREVLNEAFRLLRPEGRLIAVVHSSPGGLPGHAYRWAWKAVSLVLGLDRLHYRPMVDLVPVVREAGFLVDATWRVPGVYWSQVLRARRPAASR